jgi:hypothetical protein
MVMSSRGDVFVGDGGEGCVATCRCWCVRGGEGNVIFPDLWAMLYITYALPPPGPRRPHLRRLASIGFAFGKMADTG